MSFLIMISIFFVIHEIEILISAFTNYIFFKRARDFDGNCEIDNKVKYIILLPCHKEYEILEETTLFYNNFIEKNKVAIYIITGNERSGSGAILEDDSYERLKVIVEKKGIDIHVIRDENEFSTKTTKLNYALNKLINDNHKKTFIGVYDFDARPHPKTIRWIEHNIANRIQSGKLIPTVYQQIPHITKGVNLKKPTIIDFLSISHIKRSLGIEGYKFYSKRVEKRIFYLMGSGMFIDLDDLNAVGGFPKYSDDIALGYRLNLLDKYQEIIPFPTEVTALSNIREYFNQLLRIYYGVFSMPIQYNILKKDMNLSISVLKYFKRLISNLFDAFREGFEFIIFISLVLISDNGFRILLLYFIMQSTFFFFYNLLFLKIILDRKVKFKELIVNSLKGGILNNIFRTAALIFYLLRYKSIESRFQLSSTKNRQPFA